MTEQYSITSARRNLPTLVRDAENGKAVALTRRGEPVAALIGCRQFARLNQGWLGFSAAWHIFAHDAGLAELILDPDELFGDIRRKEADRNVWL